MKGNKKIVISIVMVVVLILAACGKNEATTVIENDKLNSDNITIVYSGSKALPDYSEDSITKAIKEGIKYIKLKIVVNKNDNLYVANYYNTKVEFDKKSNIGLLTDTQFKNYKYKNGESISTLQDVLVKHGKKTTYVIETSMNNNLLMMEDKISKIIKNEKTKNNVVFSSFDLESLLSLKNKLPDVSNIYLVKNANRGFVKDYAEISKIDFLALNQLYINETLVEYIHDKEKRTLSFSQTDSESTLSVN